MEGPCVDMFEKGVALTRMDGKKDGIWERMNIWQNGFVKQVGIVFTVIVRIVLASLKLNLFSKRFEML